MRKIKEKNNINNNKYIWEVEFRGGKSRENIGQKYVISIGPQIQGPSPRTRSAVYICWYHRVLGLIAIKGRVNSLCVFRDV
jgi:hypothetical protein